MLIGLFTDLLAMYGWLVYKFVSNVWRFKFEFEYNKSYLLDSFMEQSIPIRFSIILDEFKSDNHKEKA